ncbi:MAG: IS66 family transposase [Pseudomonadota bacterium]
MTAASSDIDALRAALAAAEARADEAEAKATRAQAVLTGTEALIATLKLEIEKLRRALYGQRSERKSRLLDQLELQLEELEAAATEDDLAAERADARAATPAGEDVRRRPARKPFPEHLPRERVVIPAPEHCQCCGSSRLAKLGEDITETLEVVPRSWKVIQTVREKVSCRDCERIAQAPAPFHPTPRGWAGPSLLAMIPFESEPSKAPPVRARWRAGQHQPLNCQAERYAREGVPLSLSTLADQVGAATVALAPLHRLIAAHVLAADRLHGDDTPVPVLAKSKTDTARLWTYVRDDRPFGGPAPPAALFRYSRDRRGVHPEEHLVGWGGVLQADAYTGFGKLYAADRPPKPVTDALCWSHARRKFFELADIATQARRGKQAKAISPLALEAVTRIDALFDLERAINGLAAEERLARRREDAAPLVAGLETWMRTDRERLSRHADVAKAMDYMLKRWDGFVRFLEDGRVCLANNAAERSLRGVALGRKAWLFAGSERGGERAAFMYALIVTARLNGIDPQAWLADVLARIADTPLSRLHGLLPWNWAVGNERRAA